MFQPQPTPYASFAAYGPGSGILDYPFQQAQVASSAGGGAGWLTLEGATCGATAGPQAEPSLLFATPALASRPGPAAFAPFNANNQTPPLQNVKMESNISDDRAAQEAAARDYQPQIQGPLVGEKTPSHIITEEYAKADPVYVQKTVALPQSYSHYRPIRGDGNCGWRAIAFSYFEALIRTGDRDLVDAEYIRLTQAPIIGHDEFVYEDMREETGILMKEISSRIGNQQEAMAVLLEKFNDPEIASPILYYLRLLASSWLKGDSRAAELIDFIPDGLGVQGYSQDYIELPGREIEHLGIVILSNVLLKPVGFVLEIAYLDRTPSPTVNTYRFPDEANNQDLSTLGPIIHLLFRPDHYDILYRDPPTSPLDIQVNRASSFSHRHEITSNTPSLDSFAGVDLGPLALIPGFTGLGPGLSSLAVTSTSPLDSYTSSASQSWLTPQFSGTGTVSLPERPPPPSMNPAPPRSSTPPLRFSEYCHPSFVESDAWHEPTFTTNTFKNSHFNVAHYNNPNFQPEEYRPDSDDAAEARGGGRKKSNA